MDRSGMKCFVLERKDMRLHWLCGLACIDIALAHILMVFLWLSDHGGLSHPIFALLGVYNCPCGWKDE